jgi:hypothetical protein
MAEVESQFIQKQPKPFYASEQPVYASFSQFACPQYSVSNTSPTLGRFLVGAALVALGGFVLYRLLEPETKRRRCSECGRESHNVARCPHVGGRRHFPPDFEKTGWCECCGRQFPKTQLHHYGGRADNSKAKEMCRPCHLHCGHAGNWGYFAINPRYCRRAA